MAWLGWAGLGWAIAILHVRRHNWTAHPLELAPWQMLPAAIPLPVAALAVEEPLTVAWSPRLIGLLSSAMLQGERLSLALIGLGCLAAALVTGAQPGRRP